MPFQIHASKCLASERSEPAPLEMTYNISMSPKVICEGAREATERVGGQGGGYPPSQGRENFAFGARKIKTVSDAYYFGAKITRI